MFRWRNPHLFSRRCTAWVGWLCLLCLALAACSTINPPPTPVEELSDDPNQVATQVAGTVYAQLTLSAGETAVARLTEIAQVPPLLPTPLPPLPTFTPVPSPTPLLPSPTPTPPVCDAAAFEGDLSIPDNTSLQGGASFTKSWRLKNVGACTWTSAYSLIFVGGDAMSASSVALPYVVHPGETVDVSAVLRAPLQPGIYRGNWMLRSANGTLFGVGTDAQGVFWVQIQVSGTPAPGRAGYDFVQEACRAAWRNENVALPCPGSINDQNGFVRVLLDPELEDRQEDEATLWLRPSANAAGWIIGEYPSYLVKGGDRFVAEIGCLADSPQCDLSFYLDYRLPDGSVRNLGSWREVEDEDTTLVSLDLSGLAGQSVNMILSVRNNARFRDANAFWLVPHIENRSVTQNELVLTWQRSGGLQSVCETLRIYLISSRIGEARAATCRGTDRDLGSARLSGDELAQVLDWVDRLDSFEGEVFLSTEDEPVTSYIALRGNGTQNANAQEINAMQLLAERLFNRIDD